MNTLYAVLVFIVTLVLYLLIQNERKRNDEFLETVYEIDYTDRSYFQKVCSTRVPVVVSIPEPALFQWLEEYYQFNNEDMKVYELDDYLARADPGSFTENHEIRYVPEMILPYDSVYQLIHNDNKQTYIAKNNSHYIQQNPQYKIATETIDKYLRPYYAFYSDSDLIYSSANQWTPFFTHHYASEYLWVVKGSITLEITNEKHTHGDTLHNLVTMETWSPDQHMERIQRIQLHPGSILYVPKYYWYRWKPDDKDTLVGKISYVTPINAIANSFLWTRHFAQMCNKYHLLDKAKSEATTSEATDKSESTASESTGDQQK